MESISPFYSLTPEVRYSPPWQNLSIIGIAGSSGSGKTSVAMEIVKSLNLPWVVILVMDSFYKSLSPEEHRKAHANEYDFDCPASIDFDLLHQRQPQTTTLYSPRVLILEGILALHDPRIVEMLDVKFCGMSVKEGGTLRGSSNSGLTMSSHHTIDMSSPNDLFLHIQRKLQEKSEQHTEELRKLGFLAAEVELPPNVHVMPSTPQFLGMNTILQNPATEHVEFYLGLLPKGTVSAVAILRGGSCLETALKRTITDCITGRVLIQTNEHNEEPELHYLKLPAKLEEHATVMLLDPQMSSGGAALMAVRVLMDHGVDENKIVFVTCAAGARGLKRLTAVFPKIKVVVGRIEEEGEPRWMERRYFGC
ncbi:Uridine kinase [Penicillium alfredii]|uniref:Uridine kinase n=1 Tax=Penicillium alfredii TaxID=1506179 RepID=A0A9W9KD75_9EURO|nr:Uridine kinase [Penicillium alfredii]KAJ5101566.1 Uridine kinase [Penicillium alfredii]